MKSRTGLGAEVAVERELVHGILSGRYRANERLPAVDALCQAFGAGYESVRTALARLAARGLVVARAGDGHWVVDLQVSIDLRLLVDVIEKADADPAQKWTLLAQTCGFLKGLFAEIVDRAARNRDGSQLEWLRFLIRMLADRIALNVERVAVGDCELQIARVLASASGCVAHTAILNSMREVFTAEFLVTGSRPLVPVETYWALMEAIANNDSTGARDIIDGAWCVLEEHCIDELKKLGWTETPSGASPG